MSQDTQPGLSRPPLDAGLVQLWQAYVDAWNAGHRSATQHALDRFLTRLDGSAQAELFARWACRTFFDHNRFWSGQFGGGLTLRNGQFSKPELFALSAYPILSRVMMPFLLAGLNPEQPAQLRWMGQFLIGQAYRLRPPERAQLRAAIAERYGPATDPVTLLDRAFHLDPDDPVSRSLHDRFHDGDD